MNPFSYGTIVKGEFFFDRSEELERIVSTLQGGNNLVLFAPRRFGKTSLVFKAMEVLEQQGYKCIYFDFFPVYSIESFAELFINAVRKKETNLNKFVQVLAELVKTIRPKLTFDGSGKAEFGIEFAENKVSASTIANLLDLPEKNAESRQKTIVIFDEFQEISKFDNIGFENLMRSRIQQQENVNYIFLGSKTHLLSDMFNNKNRAFYNSAFQIQLGALPEADTITYIKERLEKDSINITDESAQYLISQAGNIPYYIQLLASEVWQYSINTYNQISDEIIKICAEKIIFLKRDYYFELFDRQSVMQKQLLKALAIDGENIFSSAYLKKHRLSAASTVQKSASVLLENGIIERSGSSYFIGDPFFKKFIVNYAS